MKSSRPFLVLAACALTLAALALPNAASARRYYRTQSGLWNPVMPAAIGGRRGLNVPGGFVQNVPQLAIVMSRGMMPSAAVTVSGSTYDRSEWRIRHRGGRYSFTDVRPLFISGAIGANHSGWVAQPQDLTVEWAMEAANTAYKAGMAATLPAGGHLLPAAGVVPSDLGIGTFGANATLMSRGAVTGLTTGQTLYGGQAASVTTTGSKEILQASSGQASQTSAFGDLSTTSRTALAYGVSPQAILGRWVSTRDLSVIFAADSVGWGAGDGTGAATQQGEGNTGGGFLARGAYAVGGAAKTVPWAKVALGGDAVVSANAPAARAILAQELPYATDLISDYIYNDVNAASRTKEQVLADLIDFGRFVNSYGVRFHWTTPIMGSSSTDNFATASGQTVNATYQAAVVYVTAGMQAAYANGTIVGGVIDTRSAWEDPSNPGKWITNGTANYCVFTDNVHPTAACHALAGAVVATYLNGLTIPGNTSVLGARELRRLHPANDNDPEQLQEAA